MARSVGELQDKTMQTLEKFILSHDADIYGVPYDERKKAYAKMRAEYLSKSDAPRKKETAQHLPVMLETANMTIMDAFKVWGIDLKWPTEQAAAVAARMDAIGQAPGHAETAEYLCHIISSFLAPHWGEADYGRVTRISGQSNPFQRIVYVYKTAFVNAEERKEFLQKLPEETASKFNLYTIITNFDIVEFPILCEALELPIHWVLCYEPEVLCLGKTPYTERFMDVYLRLSSQHQTLFDEITTAVEAAVSR